MDFFIKLGRHVYNGERMNAIDFGGQRLKVKVTMDIYGNKLVNMIETQTLCISLSNLADMFNHGERIDRIHFEGQRSRSEWTYNYGNKLVNMIETKPFCISLSNLADMNHGQPY